MSVGPNGPPVITCGLNGGEDCEASSVLGCDESTIVVTEAESVVCNEYMAANYPFPGQQGTFSTTRTVGTTWSVGGFVGLNIGSLAGPLAFAGFSASYSETVTTGNTVGVTDTCGAANDPSGAPNK
ncbi:hypothetical protein LTR37_014114 [Vermiconidia calcicola]|uniref:Uncharacterized protein n=1 Tax=Vermiconidia calcicola TaxID=1690605 RepID=A0ACC3MUN9_9PEZI|nr:hypothetical protein LTR37_014114 [Vermiconidia calcicola]